MSVGADREAPASQKWSYAGGAIEQSVASGFAGGAVPVRVFAGREARGPAGVYLGDLRRCARSAVEPTADEHGCAPDGEVPLVMCWDSSSAFICEIRGKPGLSGVHVSLSSGWWRSVKGRPAVLTDRPA